MSKNKVVFITGASSGLGKECVLNLIANGYYVFMVSRNKGKLLDIIDGVKKASKVTDKVINYFCADVTNYGEIKQAVGKCINTFGKIDILINNAGMSRMDLISEIKISDWDDVINTNLNGYFYTTRLILPMMIKNNSGHIINIGSTMSKATYPGFSAYNASKFGVKALTDALSKEVINKKIKVTFIGPAAIDTNIHAHIKDCPSEEERKKIFMRTKDIAETILFTITRPQNLVINEIYLYNIKSSYKVPLEL